MKFGHHGANHPVKDLDTGRGLITSQNHGFAVDETTLPAPTCAPPT
jgi:carbamoyl-phosphate synthase small subunit